MALLHVAIFFAGFEIADLSRQTFHFILEVGKIFIGCIGHVGATDTRFPPFFL
jgi:hypothetical protein